MILCSQRNNKWYLWLPQLPPSPEQTMLTHQCQLGSPRRIGAWPVKPTWIPRSLQVTISVGLHSVAEWTPPLDIETTVHYLPKLHWVRDIRNRRMRWDPISRCQHLRGSGFERRIYVSTNQHIQQQPSEHQLGPQHDNKWAKVSINARERRPRGRANQLCTRQAYLRQSNFFPI